MTIVFMTQEAREGVKKLGVSNNVQEFVENCESRTFHEAFQLFEMRYPYLYKRISNYRLVAKVETVKDVEAICILDILKKGDKDSNDFNADHFKFGQEKLEKLLDRNLLEAHVAREIQRGLALEDSKKNQIPGELFYWLEPFERAENTDELILESHQWVNKFQSEDYKKSWTRYFELVKQALYSREDRPVPDKKRVFIVHDDKSGRSILYTTFVLEENHAGSESVIFLLDARKVGEIQVTRQELKDFDWIDEKDEVIRNIDAIAPYAARSYLSLVLADEDLWYQTETNDAANPALSAEELALLARVRHAPLDEPVLPIFINGRAGSGKSTMLYHLFSDYLHRKATQNLDGDVLFLTYSNSLLNTARENVRKLIKARADLNMSGTVKDIEVSLPGYDRYFQPFFGFIKEYVPAEVLAKDFPADKYVEFSDFKRLFGKYTLNNKLSPDLCWHVIRTFIKGYSLNGYLTPDEYEDLPQREKSVSPDVFMQVYITVWDKYHESGYWDTQDLVRRILQESWASPKYSVVFCDEAQDFTRLELDFILRLLIYRNYDLGWTRYIRLPFALAGDPFQTLNPTGFRWEAIKASFYDEVVGNLDPFGRRNIEFEYKELSYNYRSQAPIVRLSNLFQLWREVLFETADVFPQKPWKNAEYIIPPRLYILNENISEDKFFSMAENSVIILPCEPGQEKEFVENNPLLRELSKRANSPLFQSPMTAKGLEYLRVILFGFGDACPEKFFTARNGELHLENEYFLNKLYVAATRAMKSLIIVDTVSGKEKLWVNTLGQEAVKPFSERSKNPAKWHESLINGITPGEYYDPQIEQVTQDPLEIARKLEEAGQTNPDLLRQAMEFYHRAGEDAKARHCEAKSLEADGKLKEAGDLFTRQGRPEDAERCYWKGKYWSDLNIWYLSHVGGVDTHRIIALLMSSDGRDKTVVSRFVDHLVKLREDDKALPVDQPQFQSAIERVTKLLQSPEYDQTEELRKFVNLIKLEASLQRQIGFENCASMLFRAEEYESAVKLWDRGNKPSSNEYQYARAMVAPDKREKIYWLDLSKKHQLIVTEYEDSNKVEFEKDTLRLIADAYRTIGKTQNALELYWQIGDTEKSLQIFAKLALTLSAEEVEDVFSAKFRTLLTNNQLDHAYNWYKEIERQLSLKKRSEYAGMYIAKLLQANRWSEATQLLGQGKAKKFIRISGEESLDIHRLIVNEIATSEKILDAPGNEKNELVKYLKEINSGGYSIWQNWINIEAMGAAVEKTGTYIDALGFYENIEQEQVSPEQLTFIRQRWLKVKNKHLEKLKTDMNSTDNRESEKLARNWTHRKKELEEKISIWGYDAKAISLLPDYPVINKKAKFEPSIAIQADWQSPVCRISVGTDLLILANVLEGSIVAFPGDGMNSKKENGKVLFHSEKLPLSGEILSGERIRIFSAGQLQQEFVIQRSSS